MNFPLGAASIEKLNTCHEDLQTVIRAAILRAPYDFSVIEGYRSLERQGILYKSGMSRIDGINKKGQHNYTPSNAVDLLPYPVVLNSVTAWEEPARFYVLAGVVLSAGVTCGIKLRLGGDWDGDGSTTNQHFQDLGHFELR